jgi:hypothetical protein
MMKFFYLIGDLQSAMLVDRELCPVDPLPFKPTSFALYLNFRCEAKGTPLIDHNGVAVIDVNGSPVVCCGKINCPSGLYSIRAAVNFLHEVAYPATCSGLYQSNCRRCEEANQALGSHFTTNVFFGFVSKSSIIVSASLLAGGLILERGEALDHFLNFCGFATAHSKITAASFSTLCRLSLYLCSSMAI